MLSFCGLWRLPFRQLALRPRTPPRPPPSPRHTAFTRQFSTRMNTPDTVREYKNFDLLSTARLDNGNILVSKWQSRRTGLRVVHIDYDTPMVEGYFVVNTEIFNDSGCPHTLEHLVFMGSEKHPYTGILDDFANRAFASGTNAWTDTDHTSYTVSTAGEDGFLRLLPIYVDHLLYPTLTDAAFVTEVHHINGEGEDSGVVYSEMEARESTVDDLMAMRMQCLQFPPGNAYRSETGGVTPALRKLKMEEIREYHKAYYVPHNLTLIVAGKLTAGAQTLLDVIQDKIESSIIDHKQDQGTRPEGWKRPFLETKTAEIGPYAQNIKEIVEFPERDESVGNIFIGWQGPPPGSHLIRKAIEMLGEYLTSSSTAPLCKEYIEIDKPKCTDISFMAQPYATRGVLHIYANCVPTEHLETFDMMLLASLNRIADEGIDMKRMAMVIDRDQRDTRSTLESSGGDYFSFTVITDALYGAEDGSQLEDALLERSVELGEWTSDQWVQLLRTYYIDPNRVVVVGQPSAALAKRIDEEEAARLEKRRQRLGDEGLKNAALKLKEAKKEKDKKVPAELLTEFTLPDVGRIAWIPLKSLQEVGTDKDHRQTTSHNDNKTFPECVQNDGQRLPFFVEYDHVKSKFVTVSCFMSLASLPNHLRPYATMYSYLFFALPVTRSSGVRLTHEEVVDQLDEVTVTYNAHQGVGGGFPEIFKVSLEVEQKNYEVAVSWLKDLMYGSHFDKERLQIAAAKQLQSLPESKRDGSIVLDAVSTDVLYEECSTSRANTILEQSEFIPRLIEQLNENPDKVISAFEDFRQYLKEPSGVRFSVAGDIIALGTPRQTFAKYFQGELRFSSLAPVPLASETLSPIGKDPAKKAVVVSSPTCQSTFVAVYGKGPTGWSHPDYAAMKVVGEVLGATESYLWKSIRGAGLAYGAHVSHSAEIGLLQFSLYRSTNPIKAFDEAKKLISDLLDGTTEDNVDELKLDAAKSTLVPATVRLLSNPRSAARQSFIDQALKGESQDFTMKMLERYQKVTIEDVNNVLRKYYLPLFDPSSSVAVVVTKPSKAQEIGQGLDARGFEVEQRRLFGGETEEATDEDEEATDEDVGQSESDSEMDSDESRS